MKKILMIGLLIFAMAGTAMAVNSSDHVTEAKSMVGDVLIYPVYLADGTGWEVNVNVINTSSEYSAVAKVVLHGGKNSREIFDFFIYLSPDDMWTATIYNENGNVKVFSDDDSARTSATVFASETNPMDVTVPNDSCDEEAYGYITIFNDWHASRAQMSSATGTDYSSGAISKSDILAVYGDSDNNGIGYSSANLLTGSFEVLLPSLGLSAAENATVLRDYGAKDRYTIGRLTKFGESSDNSIAEVEAELSKETVFMPYYNDGKNITANIFTFPTKQTEVASDCERTGVNSLFFQQHTSSSNDYCIEYGIKPFNLSEGTPGSTDPIFSPVPEGEKRQFCDEVNVSVVNLDNTIDWFDEGWALFTFQLNTGFITSGPTDDNSQTVYYTGAPVIPLSANLGADGLSLKYGAYSNLEGESRAASAGNGDPETGYWYDFGTLD